MGKIRKLRQKYHLTLRKSKSLNNISEICEQKKEDESNNNSFMKSKENIFEGINISLDGLNTSLPADFDVRSIVSTQSRKELKEEERHLKKKDKIKLRHERFLKKLDIKHQLLKNSKTKQKKQKKTLGGDMSSLLEALPSLESLERDKLSRKHEKQKTKNKGILKAKERLKQQSLDTEMFKQILDDKTFRQNPLQAITQYVKQKVAQET